MFRGRDSPPEAIRLNVVGLEGSQGVVGLFLSLTLAYIPNLFFAEQGTLRKSSWWVVVVPESHFNVQPNLSLSSS